jgi:protein-L-isoaspartate(D-aspartate) O-methyltransferase
MTDFAAARRNMVDGQVRTADVTDLRIISAMQAIPRERFLAPAMAGLAYLDLDVPLGAGADSARRMIKPMVLARMIQAADLAPTDHVLDLGCVTGYAAAVLAQVAGNVVALEEDETLAEAARANLASQANVTVTSGRLADGWPQAAPYDAIVVEGAAETALEALFAQLKDGGRLVCVLGGKQTGGRPLFDATAPVLPGFAKRPEFSF